MPAELSYAETVLPLTEADAAVLVAAVDAALAVEGQAGREVSLHFGDDALLHELNLRYRDVDRPTDVLSFLLADPGDDADQALGDVVISRERAVAQARAYGHSEQRELCFLAVHGTLHLLGYDDAEPQDEAEMAARAEAALAAVGVRR